LNVTVSTVPLPTGPVPVSLVEAETSGVAAAAAALEKATISPALANSVKNVRRARRSALDRAVVLPVRARLARVLIGWILAAGGPSAAKYCSGRAASFSGAVGRILISSPAGG